MKSTYKLSLISIFILLISFSTSCSKSSTEPMEEHADAEGLTLTLNGSEVVRVDEGSVTGSISIPVGTETARITLHFLDHDGEEFTPDDPDFSLGHSFSNNGIIELKQDAGDGTFNFHLDGIATGTTTLTLELLHGDHPDFQSPPITIVVN